MDILYMYSDNKKYRDDNRGISHGSIMKIFHNNLIKSQNSIILSYNL